jgi:hypothetical protein
MFLRINENLSTDLFGGGVALVVHRLVTLNELARKEGTLDERTQRMTLIWKK